MRAFADKTDFDEIEELENEKATSDGIEIFFAKQALKCIEHKN